MFFYTFFKTNACLSFEKMISFEKFCGQLTAQGRKGRSLEIFMERKKFLLTWKTQQSLQKKYFFLGGGEKGEKGFKGRSRF